MVKKLGLGLLALILLAAPLVGQEISEKKDIAVFALSYYDWSIPNGALGMVDSQITGVFVNLGRFNVKGMTYRLSSGDIDDFIERIRQANESNMEVDEKFRLGEETFTEADFNKIVNSFIIVVPVMTYYSQEQTSMGNYTCEMATTFNFIDVSTSTTFAFAEVETSGSGDTPQEAAKTAADAIAPSLTYEIRSIPQFQLKSGVLEVDGSEVVIELGRNMGIMKGDEYTVMSSSTTAGGREIEDKSGLIIIKDVQSDFSLGYTVYAADGVYPGDQVVELPRFGSDVSVYVNQYFSSPAATTVGLKYAQSRGFFNVRPIAGIEMPFSDAVFNADDAWWGFLFFPVNVYAGAEYIYYMGRLDITASAALGATGVVPITIENSEDFWDSFTMTHLGGVAEVKVDYLIGDNLKLFVKGGFGYYLSILGEGSVVQSYGGPLAGAGATFKL